MKKPMILLMTALLSMGGCDDKPDIPSGDVSAAQPPPTPSATVPSSVKGTVHENAAKAVERYIETLSKGDSSYFLDHFADAFAERSRIHQDYPQAMWSEKEQPLRQKWESALDAQNPVKPPELHTHAWRRASNLKATVIETRKLADNAARVFVRLDFAHEKEAPMVPGADGQRVHSEIFQLTVTDDGQLLIDRGQLVDDSVTLYPLTIPDLDLATAEQMIEQELAKELPTVAMSIAPSLAYGQDLEQTKKLLQNTGFTWKVAKVLPGTAGSGFFDLDGPPQWNKYLVAREPWLQRIMYVVADTPNISRIEVKQVNPRIMSHTFTFRWTPNEVSAFVNGIDHRTFPLFHRFEDPEQHATVSSAHEATFTWTGLTGWTLSNVSPAGYRYLRISVNAETWSPPIQLRPGKGWNVSWDAPTYVLLDGKGDAILLTPTPLGNPKTLQFKSANDQPGEVRLKIDQ